MKQPIEHFKYDTSMCCSDWRYSAAIVGIIKYFEFHNIDYDIVDDSINYSSDSIIENKYLEFVEQHFSEFMHHIKLKRLLQKEELNETQIKEIKKIMMKKVYEGIKYPDCDIVDINKRIEENKFDIIKSTYVYGHNLYTKFLNVKCFFSDKKPTCRLIGYTLDANRKTKAAGYNWDKDTYVHNDCLEFDFIPFAFTNTADAMFINNNINIKALLATYEELSRKEQPRQAIFDNTKNVSTFIDYDVEVIIKPMGKAPFETMYIRKQAIDIFKKIQKYDLIKQYIKLNDNYYINIEKETTNAIVNNIKLDNIIELCLKKHAYSLMISELININYLIYGGDFMEKSTKIAYATAKEIVSKIDENKVESFQNKLITAITTKNYDGFNNILLKLSNYSGVELSFAYGLFEDFEENKNLAYTFVNALRVHKKGGETDE